MTLVPTTITALLILLLVGLPGFLGDQVFRSFVGLDLRAKQWEVLPRWLSFSVVGLVLYTLLSELFRWPLPIHVIPRSISAVAESPGQLLPVVYSFTGHMLASVGAGGLAVLGKKALTRMSPVSFYQNVWDEFARSHVRGRWIVVSLKSGDVFAGILARGQLSVSREERDIVIEEPAQYNEDANTYTTLPYQYLYLSGDSIYSIAACSLPGDSRTTKIWRPIFLDEANDGGQ